MSFPAAPVPPVTLPTVEKPEVPFGHLTLFGAALVVRLNDVVPVLFHVILPVTLLLVPDVLKFTSPVPLPPVAFGFVHFVSVMVEVNFLRFVTDFGFKQVTGAAAPAGAMNAKPANEAAATPSVRRRVRRVRRMS